MTQTVASWFQSDLGWFGIIGTGSLLQRIWFGYASDDQIRAKICESLVDDDLESNDWHPTLRQRLQRFASGARIEFDDIELDLSWCSDFQSQVIQRARRIPYGHTLSYGELAEQVGRARAARAVGTVMSSNRYPIVVPCHRVLAAGKKLGGFSTPGGISVKQHMLNLESAHVAS